MNSELKNDGLAFLFGRTTEAGGLLLHWLAGGPRSLLRKGFRVCVSMSTGVPDMAFLGRRPIEEAAEGVERHWFETGDEIFLPLISVVRVVDTFLVGVLLSFENGFQPQPSAVRSWIASDSNNAKASQRSKVFTAGTPRKPVSFHLPRSGKTRYFAAMVSLET